MNLVSNSPKDKERFAISSQSLVDFSNEKLSYHDCHIKWWQVQIPYGSVVKALKISKVSFVFKQANKALHKLIKNQGFSKTTDKIAFKSLNNNQFLFSSGNFSEVYNLNKNGGVA